MGSNNHTAIDTQYKVAIINTQASWVGSYLATYIALSLYIYMHVV